MKQIPLSGLAGYGRFALVDDEDYEYLSQFMWSIDNYGYANRARKIEKNVWRPKRMHHDIIPSKNGQIVDHINRNRLDNRRENLRICSSTESIRNRGLNKNNSTGYKGVYYNQKRSKYQAYITVNRRHIYLGAYDNPTDAARAYDKSAVENFGEFSSPNFVGEL